MARSADPLDNDPPTERTEPLKKALDALDADAAQLDQPATRVDKKNMKLARKNKK